MKRPVLPVLALVAVAAAPASASAAAIKTSKACYVEGEPMQIVGQGFTPLTGWTVHDSSGQISAFGNADPSGNVALTGPEFAPVIVADTTKPRTYTLTATDNNAASVPVASMKFKAVNFLVKYAGRGNPRKRVPWRFSGFAPGRPIYVHVRRGGKTLKTTRIGRAKGPCGTLTKRSKRLPVRASQVRSGNYKVFVDSSRRFARSVRPQYRFTYNITLTYRFR